MSRLGICFLNLQKKIDELKVILERDDVRDLRNLQANKLSMEMRLLHNIISRIFFPKIKRFNQVTKEDISFMYYLIQGKPINLSFFMLRQIKEAMKKSRTCLSYGMVFILIFINFAVDCEGEDGRKLLHTDRYNKRSLNHMGYLKVDDRWEYRALG